MESWPRRHRITVDEYHHMAEAGVLAPDARVELIEGDIIQMVPIGQEHASVVDQLTRLFIRAVGDDAIVRVQGSVRLGRMSAPEPDLVLLRPTSDFYRSAFPTGADMLLVIEVSDSTLRYDREVKVPLYARNRVPAAWIIDLQSDRLLVYTEPRAGEYQRQSVVARPGRTTVTALPGLTVDLAGIFG